MIYLILCILSSSMIYVIFRVAKNYNCKLQSLITINYLAASLLGILLFQPFADGKNPPALPYWMPFAVILGILFIAMFYLIGYSSQKTGITVTTLANKLSLVFPVTFSLIYFNEQLSTVKAIGIVTAIIAVALTVYKKEKAKINLIYIGLPLSIFFGSGLIDSIVKYVQAIKITESETSLYTILVFVVAFLCGVIISIFTKAYRHRLNPVTLLLGTLLGVVNFGSLYFMIEALNKSGLQSSLVFALNNMAIVAFTAILGTLLFKERLNKINFAGVVLALISLYFLL
ncbi:EamA family transporter [Draconibacterium sp. IB214405]|uniref:EamA family transporter n=1 Tax=Draconibacterium sp. IB214405 TaxID=3097352 RepID=UPI002A0AEF86|nr:EamA family transporter [Draconibacterium sp. IB214405]MDX8339435.1 EamA family transporter [Draconibacterium sp. IB214405]